MRRNLIQSGSTCSVVETKLDRKLAETDMLYNAHQVGWRLPNDTRKQDDAYLDVAC